MSKDKKALKKASSVFARAAMKAEEAKGGNEWEDGKYAAQITDVEITESQNGNKMVVLTYKGLQGQYKGEEIKDFRVVGEGDDFDEEKLGRFFSYTLKPLGIDFPEDESEFQDLIKSLAKKKLKVMIKVKTNGEYKNINIQKPLSDDDIDDAEGSEETAEDEDTDEEGTTLEVGMAVTAEIDGEEIEGTITKLLEKKGKVVIEDEDGEEHKVALEDVTVSEAKENDDDDEDKENEDEGDDDDTDEDEDEDESDDDDDDDDEEPKKSKVSKKKSKLKKKK